MLYICATPIGNLKDITIRALDILSKADIILCEDTRNSKVLFNAHGLRYQRLVALHEHNENQVAHQVIEWLQLGLTIVQISDAGTPGISDPGARLCDRVLSMGYRVSPLPGACAYVSLLSVAGLNASSLFYGFLPSTRSKRIKALKQWSEAEYAVCIYEAPHRIVECIEDMVAILGADRIVVMGRELTKQYETIRKMTAYELLMFIKSDANQQRGEFVLLIFPTNIVKSNVLSAEQIATLNLLAAHVPPKKAALLTSQIIGGDKNLMYNFLVDNK